LWDEALGVRGDQRGTYEDTELQDRIREAGEAVWFCRDAVVAHRVPREAITPARVLETAFTHGRNAFWRPAFEEGGVERAPRRPFVPGLIVLAWQLGWLATWAIMFRFTHAKSVFERARGTARSAGHAFDSLLPGRESSKLNQFVRRLAFRSRTEALRLVEVVR
jgi:GT2 family glycosyltransferase